MFYYVGLIKLFFVFSGDRFFFDELVFYLFDQVCENINDMGEVFKD